MNSQWIARAATNHKSVVSLMVWNLCLWCEPFLIYPNHLWGGPFLVHRWWCEPRPVVWISFGVPRHLWGGPLLVHTTTNGVDHGWWGGPLLVYAITPWGDRPFLVYAIVGGVDHMSHAPKMVQPWRTPKVACTKNGPSHQAWSTLWVMAYTKAGPLTKGEGWWETAG